MMLNPLESYYILIVGSFLFISSSAWAPDVISLDLLGKTIPVDPSVAAKKLERMLDRRKKLFAGSILYFNLVGYKMFLKVQKMNEKFSSGSHRSSSPLLYTSIGPLSRLFNHFRMVNLDYCLITCEKQAKQVIHMKDPELLERIGKIVELINNQESDNSREQRTPEGRDLIRRFDTNRGHLLLQAANSTSTLFCCQSEMTKPKEHLENLKNTKVSQDLARKYVIRLCKVYLSGFEQLMTQLGVLLKFYNIKARSSQEFNLLIRNLNTCVSLMNDRRSLDRYIFNSYNSS